MAPIVEFRIRPVTGKTREDQQDAARVFFTVDALTSLRVKPGEAVNIWKVTSLDEYPLKRMGIAWALPSAQSMGKGVLQMHNVFKDACGFKLEDRVSVEPAGSVRFATTVTLTEAEGQNQIPQEETLHWETVLKYGKLGFAKSLFTGMILETVLPGMAKRSFNISALEDETGNASLMSFALTTTVRIISGLDDIEGQQNVSEERKPLGIVNMVGIDQALSRLNQALQRFNDADRPTSLSSRKGVIVHGTSGTGKSFLLDKIASSNTWPTFRVNRNTKPKDLKTLFDDAKASQPSLVIMDQLDVSASDEQNVFVEALVTELEALQTPSSVARVVVVGAAQSLNSLSKVLQTKAFEQIAIQIPDAKSRRQILDYHLNIDGMSATSPAIIEILAETTHAYTGGDLRSLLVEAYHIWYDRLKAEGHEVVAMDMPLIQSDITKARTMVKPSAMHDINLAPPKVLWDDIGGQETVKKALRRSVEVPQKYPQLMSDLGMSSTKGLLMYGPPGCSKTLSAQAMATEAGFNFFAVKGAELLNMYVGESERAVREIFSRARAARPAIIFFDEIESIGAKRAAKNGGVNVLTTLLNEMDGIEVLEGVTVLAATNQPESLDLALLRPGRFDDLLYVAPPDQSGREAILKIRKRKANFADDVDISALAKLLDGHTGAEIVSVCRKAAEHVLDRCIETEQFEGASLSMADFEAVLPKVKMQVTSSMIERYERWAAGLETGVS